MKRVVPGPKLLYLDSEISSDMRALRATLTLAAMDRGTGATGYNHVKM